MSKILYSEKQYFRKTTGFYLLSIFVFTIVVVFGIELFQQTWDENLNSFARDANPDFIKAFVVVLLFLLYIFISAFRLKLETIVSEESISYSLVPFVKRQVVLKEELKSFEIRKGKSVSNYRGSAFRRIFGMKKNAFLLTGENAMLIRLINGKSILLGTQRPEMFLRTLERNELKKGMKR